MAQVKSITGKSITVKVGDVVGFKCDVEQYARISKIVGDTLYFENEWGFEGDYIGGQTEHSERASDCWID